MRIVCLDLEGVLVPEIWIAFAEKTGVSELTRTTRDEPDYGVLMQYRLDILSENKFGLSDIQCHCLDGSITWSHRIPRLLEKQIRAYSSL